MKKTIRADAMSLFHYSIESQVMASQSHMVSVPATPAEFPELKSQTVERLEQLEMNQAALDEFVSELAFIQNFQKAKEETEAKTHDLATTNISFHTQMVKMEADIEAISQKLEDVRTRTEISFAEKDALMSKFTPKNILKDLEMIAETTDRDTERILYDFTSIESAKTAILSQRMLHHKAKALADLISSHGSRAISPRSSTR